MGYLETPDLNAHVSSAATAFKLPEVKCTVRESRIIAASTSIWTIRTFAPIRMTDPRPKLGLIGLLGRLYRRCSSLNLFRRLCGLVGANRICAFSMRAS
jgi:hypothetical protein